jgi:galactokinase
MSIPEGLWSRAEAAFAGQFGGRPSVVGCAPGRVELLGNHTDYNGGLVMAAAVDRFTLSAGRPQDGRGCRAHSVNFESTHEFNLDALRPGAASDWASYVQGVAWTLQQTFAPLASGFDMAIVGDVPLGAGLSSSASLEAAVAFSLLQAKLVPGLDAELLRHQWFETALMTVARALQRAENEYVGVASGLLDQFSSLFGRAHHALYLDCRTLEHERLPLGEPGPAIVVCDSKTSRRLADGMYNRRRAECETVVAYFQALRVRDAVTALRDVSLDELREHWDKLDPVGRKRARHVLNENDRVRRGAEALRAGRLEEFGRLISASHASSRDDFENSSPALDALIEVAEDAPGFLGGKLSGAGWAGCTVNLVRAERAADFAEAVRADYSRASGIAPDFHICEAAEGALGREAG